MTHVFKLIATPCANFDILLSIAHGCTKRNLAEIADKQGVKASEKKLLYCLNNFARRQPTTVAPFVLSHLWFAGFLVCNDESLNEITSLFGDMAMLTRETELRGVSASIISGNLNDWVCAVQSGLKSDLSEVFTTVVAEFGSYGFAQVFPESKNTQRLN